MQNNNKKIKQLLKDSRLHSKKASDEIRTQGDMKVVERDLKECQQLNNAALREVRKNGKTD